MKLALTAALLAMLGCVAPAPGLAQGNVFPTKPIRVLSPSSPGGGADTITRAMVQKYKEITGFNALVDNHSGANGVVAMNMLAQAAPDGYTLFAAGNLVVLNGVLGKVSYDIRTAFEPVVQMTSQPYLLVINPGLPVSSVKDLIALSKSKPGTLSYGSSGTGSVIHLGTEMMKSMTGMDMVHIPYKGNAPAFVDLISGRIQMLYSSGFGVAPHLKSGKLKAIAVASTQRLASYPDLPLVGETIPGYSLENAYSVFAPGGTPSPVLGMLNADISRTMNSPDMKAKLMADGADTAAPNTPAQFKASYLREVDMWDKFIKTSKIKLDD